MSVRSLQGRSSSRRATQVSWADSCSNLLASCCCQVVDPLTASHCFQFTISDCSSCQLWFTPPQQ